MKHANWLIVLVIIVLVAGVVYFSFFQSPQSVVAPLSTTTSPPAVSFYCSGNKSIQAVFATSTVALTLSDGRVVTLPQQRMGSGIRYEATTTIATSTEDLAFLNEGDVAFLTENGRQTYSQCIAARIVKKQSDYQYTNQEKSFSFIFPQGFLVSGNAIGMGYSTSWATFATTSGMTLAEVGVGKNYMPGTNFSDASFTVGVSADPSALATCTQNPAHSRGSSSLVTINGVPFTKLSFQDAAAGNRYDTASYRTVRNGMCYAVEYTIHYGVFQNYPAGAVTQFNELAVQSVFDKIAQSFTFIGQ